MNETSKISSMAFYHPDGFVAAWNQAKEFAGERGRIATLPDIITARLATKPGSFAWESYFTTVSSEFMWYSKYGTQILIVAHGIGPMFNLEGVLKAYSYEFKDRNRNNRGGRITEKEFRDLESGKHGNVDIIDLVDYARHYEYPFLEIINTGQALEDPLLKARLGPKAEEYILLHTKFAREWHAQQGEIKKDNTYNLSNWDEHELRRKAGHRINTWRKHPVSPFILQVEGAANCPYGYRTPQGSFISFLDKIGNLPLAHLISIGRLSHVHHERWESLVSVISLHEWWNGVRVVGIRANSKVTDIHHGVDNIRELMGRYWSLLMVAVEKPVILGFVPLVKFAGKWFTQYPKAGVGMDTGEPEFLVQRIALLGESREFVTPTLGYYGFFNYDIRDVKKLAPRGANAYYFTSEPENIVGEGGSDKQKVMIQFCEIESDTTQRLMRVSQIYNNYDLLMRLISISK